MKKRVFPSAPPSSALGRGEALERLGRAHYVDAELYERRYRRRVIDLEFYGRLAARARGGVLELGAGTGRVTRTLVARSRAGSVVAVEREPALAAVLRARVPGAELVLGDLRRLRLGRRFGLVLAPFNTLSHCYARAALQAALATVRAHLAPRGVFAFDVPMPDPDFMRLDPTRRYRVGFVSVAGERLRYDESFDYEPATQLMTTVAYYGEEFVLPLVQRWFFPQELGELLGAAGFDVVRHDGGFCGEPIGRSSESQVVVCRRS